MPTTTRAVPRLKQALMWVIFVGFTVGLIIFLLSNRHERTAEPEPASGLARAILTFFAAGFFLTLGVASYFILIATDCFTFKFDRPIWTGMKAKLYFANIVVLTGTSLGLGFAISPFVGPILNGFGTSGEIAFLLPVMAMVVILQIVRVFVLIWAPMEKRIIKKRLLARGITSPQLEPAMLVGISNPLRSSFKKLSQVEEDIGAMWVGPEQIVYWGDNEQFGITREQLVQIERRADAGGTTLLGGVTHIILHAKQPDGSERQLRLHTEGHWTMGAKGRAMDELEERILKWLREGAPPAPAA